jgi:hypothetical protein
MEMLAGERGKHSPVAGSKPGIEATRRAQLHSKIRQAFKAELSKTEVVIKSELLLRFVCSP